MIHVGDDRIGGGLMIAKDEDAVLVLFLVGLIVVLYCRLVWLRDGRSRHRVSKVPWIPLLVAECVWLCESPVSSHFVTDCEGPGC